MGRTARGEGARGNALLFLIPEELQFLRYLKVKYFDYITWGNRTKTYERISDNLSATLKTVMISVKLRQHDVLSLKSRKQDEKISCFFFFGFFLFFWVGGGWWLFWRATNISTT